MCLLNQLTFEDAITPASTGVTSYRSITFNGPVIAACAGAVYFGGKAAAGIIGGLIKGSGGGVSIPQGT